MPPDFDTTDAAVIALMGETVIYTPGGGSLLFFDEFDRAGPALGPDWTTPAIGPPASPARFAMEIGTPGTAQPISAIQDTFDAAYTGLSTPDNQFAETVIAVLDGGNFDRTFGVYVRVTLNTRSAYEAEILHSTTTSQRFWHVNVLQNGPAINLGNAIFDGPPWPAGTTIRLEAIGTTINWYIDGVLIFTGTDSENSSGFPGMECFGFTDPALVQVESFKSGGVGFVKGFFQSPDDEPDTQDIDFIATSPQVILTNVDAPSPNLADLFTIRTVSYTVKDFEADESALVVFHLLEV